MSLPLPNADLPPFSCFSSEQQQQKPQQEIMDSMAISALEQFRSAPQPLTSPQKLWGSLPRDHSHHYRYHDPAPKENTGLGLGMGMGIGMDMSMAAMAAAAAAGMSMGNLVPLSQDPNSMPPWSIMDSTLTPIPMSMSMSMGIESLALKTTPIATAGNSSELLSFALTPAKSKIGSGDVGWSLHNSHQQQQQEHGQRRWQQLEQQQQQQQFQAAVAEERNSDNTKVTKQESSHNHNDKDVVDSVPRYAYRECRRNHAAHKGSTVVLDGCCNFMPQLELDDHDHDHDQNDEKQRQGPLAMLCGACGCHRNFHRRVALTKDGMDMDMDMDMDADDTITTTTQERPRRSLGECVATIKDVANSVALCVTNTLLLLDMDLNSASFIKSLECLRSAATSMLAAADCLSTLQSAEGRHEPPSSSSWKVHLAKLNRHSSSRQNGYDKKAEFCGSSKQKVVKEKEKRKRTRFSAEQIRKLNDFGSEVGWTLAGLSKHHIEGVCAHIGIEATTLKYWLYNTRQKSKRRSSSSSSAIPAALPSTSASPPPFSEQHQEHVEAAQTRFKSLASFSVQGEPTFLQPRN